MNKIKNGYYDKVEFHKNGEKYVFKTEPNPYNNYQMWWFEPLVGMKYGTVKDAKTIAKNIRLWNEGKYKVNEMD